jgi:alpha-glucosidase
MNFAYNDFRQQPRTPMQRPTSLNFPFVLALTIFGSGLSSAQPGPALLRSPDARTEVRIATHDSLTIEVSHNGSPVVLPSTIALTVASRKPLGHMPVLLRSKTSEIRETITPPVAEKRRTIPDNYNQMTLDFQGNYSLIVRAYDDGIAYRFRTEFPDSITITDEELIVRLLTSDSLWFPAEDSFLSHSERLFQFIGATSLPDTLMCCVPMVVSKTSGVRLAVTEADLLDYPGLYLRGTAIGNPALRAVFPAYPEEEQLVGDRTVKVTKRAPFIARTRGTRDFPWRVFGIADRDGALIENDIVYRLGSPCVLKETSWIKPGKVAWDWWNANNIAGVDFKAGINTKTYMHYIDFAAKYGIEYVIFDEGWTKPGDLNEVNPEMDMDRLFTYAKKKHVGIILWVTWTALDNRMTEALDRFAAWGAAGIKVDFMQRDDQKMVNYYERVAKEGARRRLLVDFHGSYKPTGLCRTYPNVLTREGVKGLENSKWSADITPAHDVTLPFTRMFAGAMDFTPGAMHNASRDEFRAIFRQPMSQGTRCHQLAMYIVFESPLQMLSDSPTNYEREPEAMEFLRAVPTTWDETRVLNAAIGQYVTVARRKGNTWYIGSMSNWTPRELELNLGFLGSKIEITVYQDGVNADRFGSDYKKSRHPIDPAIPLRISLAAGGGWLAIVKTIGNK